MISENNELFNSVYDFTQKIELIKTDPKLAVMLSENEIFNLVYNEQYRGDMSFISFLPKDLQEKMLLGDVKYIELEELSDLKKIPSYKIGRRVKLSIEYFSEDVILKSAFLEEITRRNNKFYKPYLFEKDLSKLSRETQVKLLKLYNEYSRVLPVEAIEEFVGGNPLLFDILPEKKQLEIISNNPSILATLSKEKQRKYLKDYRVSGKYTLVKHFNMYGYNNPEEAKNQFFKMRYITDRYFGPETWQVADTIKEYDFIWEIGKFDPQFLKVGTKNTSRDKKIIDILYQHSKIKNPNSKITEFLQDCINNGIVRDETVEMINRISKILTNDDIIRKINQDDLFDYVISPNHEKLVKIIECTYGSQSAQVLRDRPKIDIELIPNMYIFHPDIIDEFGIGAVHATLSYTMNLPAEFSEFIRYPQKMLEYKRFSKLTNGIYENTAISLDRKIIAFEYARELLSNIPNGLTEEQIECLYLAVNDVSFPKEQLILPFPKNLEELNAYKNQRNSIYDEAILKTSDPEKIKNIISQRFFGLEYSKCGRASNLIENTVIDMCRFYDLGRFVNEQETLHSGNFSQDDLDSLELLDIIRSVDNPEALREISTMLSENEVAINPARYKDLSLKVPRQYTKEFVDRLISPKKAEEMIAQKVSGIKKREKDGITIITLDGCDFLAYVSNPYMNNSVNSNLEEVSELKDISKIWREHENGISTFSGCAIDQDEARSTISSGKIGLGFSSIHPSQIVAMSPYDAQASHSSMELEPRTSNWGSIKFSYPDELMRQTAERLEVEDKKVDRNHEYNEVTSQRRVQDLSQIEQNTYGGKIDPNYIYTYGKLSGERGIELAKKFGLKYIFEYNNERYINRAWERGMQNPKETIDRPESEFIRRVKEIARGDGEEIEI